MKSLLLLPLLWMAPVAWAQNTENSTAPVATAPIGNRQISLTLAKGQAALVRDRRTVSLPAGRALLRFPDVPGEDLLDKESLQLSLDRTVTVLRQENGGVAAPGYGLASFVGKQVTLLRPQSNVGGISERAVTGTLLSAASPVLLETPDGVLLNPTGVWVLPREGRENLGAQPFRGAAWQVEAARAGDFPAEVFYATSNLGWSARYTATLAGARNRLNLRGWLQLNNGTQTLFPNAQLAFRDENGVAFAPPRPANLGVGDTQLAYVAADVPVAESLIYARQSGSNFTQAVNGAHPQRSMTLENSLANDLGVYLPRGTLSLWQGGDDLALRLDKIASWGGWAPADLIAIPLGTEDGIFIDRTIAASKLLNPVTREITVVWKVTTEGGARALTILDQVPPRFKLTGATLKPSTVVNNQLRFEVNASATTPVEFRYTVEVPA